jgi:hypothetical protein
MYVHLDCNNFFVSCELVSRPELKGTPVVVANNNDNNGGIILALNQEAKAVGLKRGNPIFQVTRIIERHHVTVIDVHHELYHEVSQHIMDEVRKTGACIFDEESGLYIACRRIGNATFWVKFSREGDGSCLVHRAWSHRMNVVKREG